MGDDGVCSAGLARTGVSSASSIVAVGFDFLLFLCESFGARGGGSMGLVESSGVIHD